MSSSLLQDCYNLICTWISAQFQTALFYTKISKDSIIHISYNFTRQFDLRLNICTVSDYLILCQYIIWFNNPYILSLSI